SLERPTEALPKAEAALALLRSVFRDDHPNVVNGLTEVGNCHRHLGQVAEALADAESALAMAQRVFQRDHHLVASSLDNVSICLHLLGRDMDAVRMSENAVAMFRRLDARESPGLVTSEVQLARLRLEVENDAVASAELLDAAIEGIDRLRLAAQT